MNLAEAFPIEQQRCRKLLETYRSLGPVGAFGAAMIESVLREADEAAGSMDAVAMVCAYQAMCECK